MASTDILVTDHDLSIPTQQPADLARIHRASLWNCPLYVHTKHVWNMWNENGRNGCVCVCVCQKMIDGVGKSIKHRVRVRATIRYHRITKWGRNRERRRTVRPGLTTRSTKGKGGVGKVQ